MRLLLAIVLTAAVIAGFMGFAEDVGFGWTYVTPAVLAWVVYFQDRAFEKKVLEVQEDLDPCLMETKE